MNETKLAVIFGALLHDVGKVVYRAPSGKGTHSALGAQFLEETIPDSVPFKREIVQQARYHHGKEMASAQLPDTLPTYITYFADNISAGIDRKNEGDDTGEAVTFERERRLRRVFNILNGHHDDNTLEPAKYKKIRDALKYELSTSNAWNEGRIGSLLNVLEAWCSNVPSSTNTSELTDISLFDHLKTTAGIAACMYDWFEEHEISDYRRALFNFEDSKRYYDEPMFLLWSCDLSGIQSFIYSISGTRALKQLRARSFYLELLLEHCMDELLVRLELTRCNLLYTGGGHTYALLPNTQAVHSALNSFEDELNGWLLEKFKIGLYCACAGVACSANDLMNKEGSEAGAQRYRELFQRVGALLSEKKAKRYSAAKIAQLNFADEADFDHSRECSECHRSAPDVEEVDGRDLCPLCAALACVSPALVKKDDDGNKCVFVVSDKGALELDEGALESGKRALELPFKAELSLFPRKEYLAKAPVKRRVYTRKLDAGIGLATHLWMGDYTAEQHGNGISDYEGNGVMLPESVVHQGEKAGIRRLGVLRADVDNLGAAFSNGFPDKYASISRTATLSRALSYFFKDQINDILENPRHSERSEAKPSEVEESQSGYRAQIIYSGGDDLFIIGNWLDVIYVALDIKHGLDEFTGNGSLTISAGIGMYDAHYPLARMAAEVGELEDAAKAHPGKNALALWTIDAMPTHSRHSERSEAKPSEVEESSTQLHVFSWDEFENDALPKLEVISDAFDKNDKGKSFIYKLIELLRGTAAGDVISVPRLAYLLTRSFEDKDKTDTTTAQQFFEWALDEQQRKALTTALEIYVYSIRERG